MDKHLAESDIVGISSASSDPLSTSSPALETTQIPAPRTVRDAPTLTTGANAPWRALPVLQVGALLPVLDAFIVNVALATLGRTLHAGSADLELTVSGYGVAYACTLVAGGRLGDRFGRRRIFLFGMLGFTLASGACGLAPTALTLVIFRIIQGFTASLITPQVLGSIQATFSGADRRRALGYFGATVGAAAVIGQVVGGALVSADVWGLSWRPIFLVNVPIGLIAIAVGLHTLPESRATAAARIDVRGAIALAATITLLLLPLALGHATGWPTWTWICLGCAVPAGWLFLIVQARKERAGTAPLLPPSLLRVPVARRGLLVVLIVFTETGGLVFCTTILLQEGRHFSALAAGLTMLPFALCFLATSFVAGRLAARYGRWSLVVGALVDATGVALFLAEALEGFGQLSSLRLAVPLALVGIGQATMIVPLIGIVLGGLPAERAGLAGGVLATAQQVSLASGAAIIGTVFFSAAGNDPTGDAWRRAAAAFLTVILALLIAAAVMCGRLRDSPRPSEQA